LETTVASWVEVESESWDVSEVDVALAVEPTIGLEVASEVGSGVVLASKAGSTAAVEVACEAGSVAGAEFVAAGGFPSVEAVMSWSGSAACAALSSGGVTASGLGAVVCPELLSAVIEAAVSGGMPVPSSSAFDLDGKANNKNPAIIKKPASSEYLVTIFILGILNSKKMPDSIAPPPGFVRALR